MGWSISPLAKQDSMKEVIRIFKNKLVGLADVYLTASLCTPCVICLFIYEFNLLFMITHVPKTSCL